MSYFTALNVPPEIAAVLHTFHRDIPGAAYTHPNDYHITLKYLGNISSQTLEAFTQGIITPVLAPQLTTLQFNELHSENQTFLVALIQPTPVLQNLHHAHEAAATGLGIAPYLFPTYIPHITLANYPTSPPKSYFAKALPSLTFTATEVILYESTHSHGTGVGRYTAVKNILLAT